MSACPFDSRGLSNGLERGKGHLGPLLALHRLELEEILRPVAVGLDFIEILRSVNLFLRSLRNLPFSEDSRLIHHH